MTDEQLIENIRNGDDSAFRELVMRHESRVAATVIGMLGDCPEADDVGQETFIRFYKNLNSFQGRSSVGTYLTRIAMNLSLNELKRRKRKSILFSTKIPEDGFDIPDENPHDQFNEEQEIIHQTIQKLAPKYRSVIVLRLMEGYSTAETAKILNLPIGTVLSRLSRGQRKLKDLLSPYLGVLK